MQAHQRQAKRSLNNPFNRRKSKSSWLRLFFTPILISLILVSIFYLFASQASPSVNDGNQVSDLIGVKDSEERAIDQKPTNNEKPKPGLLEGEKSGAHVIAYAISLTSCGSAESPPLVDGAAVLKHSVHLSSIRNADAVKKSKYDYQMIAIIHNDAKSCQPIIEKMGYKTMLVDVPVPVAEIQGDKLREAVHNSGCCGELEFIKLWAYTITDYPLVVHLDLDTLILQPMDDLFDAALSGSTDGIEKSVMWENELHKGGSEEGGNDNPINAFFTRDYNMVKAGKKPVGVQGGFIVLKPSHDVFEEFRGIIREGNYDGRGWGGLGYAFYGSMTFQGIIPYYYDAIHPGTAVELNRCIYNTMADNPRDQETVNDVVSGKCRDGRDVCEDCRERGIEEIVTAHFTLCQKPWSCLPHGEDMLQHRLCRKLFAEWYRIRADWELSRLNRNLAKEEKDNGNQVVVVGQGKTQPEHFRGFCNSTGKKGYLPVQLD